MRLVTNWERVLMRRLRREDASADDGSFVGVSYQPEYGDPPNELVDAMADLIMLLYAAEADAAEPASWRLGGAVSALAWESLLRETDGGYPKLRPWLGEAL